MLFPLKVLIAIVGRNAHSLDWMMILARQKLNNYCWNWWLSGKENHCGGFRKSSFMHNKSLYETLVWKLHEEWIYLFTYAFSWSHYVFDLFCPSLNKCIKCWKHVFGGDHLTSLECKWVWACFPERRNSFICKPVTYIVWHCLLSKFHSSLFDKEQHIKKQEQ